MGVGHLNVYLIVILERSAKLKKNRGCNLKITL